MSVCGRLPACLCAYRSLERLAQHTIWVWFGIACARVSMLLPLLCASVNVGSVPCSAHAARSLSIALHALPRLRDYAGWQLSAGHCCAQNKSHALNDEIVVNALAGVVGVGVTYIKDDEDIVPLLKASCRPRSLDPSLEKVWSLDRREQPYLCAVHVGK